MLRGQTFVPATEQQSKTGMPHEENCLDEAVAATCPCFMSRVCRPLVKYFIKVVDALSYHVRFALETISDEYKLKYETRHLFVNRTIRDHPVRCDI